jgi:hypothetical protein
MLTIAAAAELARVPTRDRVEASRNCGEFRDGQAHPERANKDAKRPTILMGLFRKVRRARPDVPRFATQGRLAALDRSLS